MKDTAQLRRRILSRRARVVVIGQGYAGLSLASAASEAEFHVTGVDIDGVRVGDLTVDGPSVPRVDGGEYQRGLATGRMSLTTDVSVAANAEVICICVPTQASDHALDLSHVEAAAREVSRQLVPGRLVILESTTYPGTTEGPFRELLETSDLRAGRDFLLACAPERSDPGSEEYLFRAIPRVVGGLTPESTGMASLFYGQLVDKVVSVSSCRAAELARLLENTYRHVNMALVNEMAMVCHELAIDVWEVIDAAASKPFGFAPFQPGLEGSSLLLDSTPMRADAGKPYHHLRTVEQANGINDGMPAYVAGRIADALNDTGKPVDGARILVLGVARTGNPGDTVGSPAQQLMDILHRRGAHVGFHDPIVASVGVNGRIMQRSELTNQVVDRADCVALIVPHRAYDLEWIAERARLVFDAYNAYGSDRRPNVARL